ncbi:MAG: bifunctional folylpolyglutamate synthase/dihydrofolate synthase [Oceanobacter sp.]
MAEPLEMNNQPVDTSSWDLDAWLEYLEGMHPTEIELGLERIKRVAIQLDCLRVAPKMILVGGTNGKGTTSALLSALLREQGLKVGCYNSPHILKYNERVSIDDQDISDADLIQSFQLVEAARQQVTDRQGQATSLTYFEFGTLAALRYFADQSLDVCVLEIGLGGRLDAVNIVEADLCIVTSIALDHQAWLGDTVEKIAYEKCAIARAGVPLICGQPGAPEIAKTTVEQQGGDWLGRGEQFGLKESGSGQLQVSINLNRQNREPLNLCVPTGVIPNPNVATALQALAELGFLPDEERICDLLSSIRVAGRRDQWIRRKAEVNGAQSSLLVTLDVAHNPQAAQLLKDRGERYQGIILAMLADKDVEAVVRCLPEAEELIIAGLDCPRGLSSELLSQRVERAGRIADRCFSTVPEAIEFVEFRSCDSSSQLNLAAPMGGDSEAESRWLVMGSFFTVEAAMNHFTKAGKDTWKNI